ncbi:MAG: glycosyltransferase family 2 protein [Caulobacter sp.]
MAQDEVVARPRVGSPARRPRLHRPALRLADESDQDRARGAAQPPTAAQWAALATLAMVLAAGFLLAPWTTGRFLHDLLFGLFSLVALSRLGAALAPTTGDPAPPLTDGELPAYTVIVALYREAEVAADLVAALESLDYPRDRLQILIVLESDDAETWRALAGLPLPGFIEVLAAPPGTPRTKPRACNIGLERARGELVTIYDAEDRPSPGQLREAAARFAAGPPRLACLQAPLRIEPDRRLLPAQFALEYAIQFEVLLPALSRLGAPFPLGGTSNHFRTAILRAVGGWDAWNVTEDADLGFRLSAEGFTMGLLRSPTFEPGPDRLSDWLPQRARWIKGYMQTFGVQSRSPPHWRTGTAVAFAVTLGAAITSAFLHGPLAAWVLTAVVLGLVNGGTPLLSLPDGSLLAVGWACATVAGVVGLRRARAPLRLRDIVLLPLYWPLHSLAAAHALVQLLDRPFHWDKTPHTRRTGQAGA